MNTDYEIKSFETADLWREWLEKNHHKADGIWIKMYKKGSGVESIDRSNALDHALCFGWIDGQAKSIDQLSYLQKYTPRRPRSMWSKRNIEYIARLEKTGLMTESGRAEVVRAKADGRWDAAYAGPKEMKMSEDFLLELEKYPQALEFYKTLNKTNVYAIAWRLATAKTEATRLRRQAKIIEMLRNGQAFH